MRLSILAFTLAAAPAALAAQPAVTSYAATPADAGDATLFAFDNYSLPFLRNLYVTMHPVRKYSGNPVVPRGPAGSADEYGAQLYGSVIAIGGKYRMWYLAATPVTVSGLDKKVQDFNGFSVCYAESEDGLHWTKPSLGLVELNGNRNNNMVQLASYDGTPATPPGPGNVLVLYEPQDPVPEHRYKMMLLVEPAVPRNINNILPLYSADGLHWRQAVPGAVDSVGDVAAEAVRLPLDHFEMGGFYHFQGMYYVSGQQETPYSWMPDGSGVGRSMSIFRSPDFIHWSGARSFGFVRWGYHTAPVSQGEEVHMPGATWNRENVLLGLYGQFHGRPHSKLHPLDLGLLISNDGIHFREAEHNFVFVPHDPQARWESGGVVQGQAYINRGDETYVYYAGWDGDVTDPKTHSEIGLGMLRRDGFGSLSPKLSGTEAFLESCALSTAKATRLCLNADGLSDRGRLKVELFDREERPIPGYAGADAGWAARSGTKIAVTWSQGPNLAPQSGPFHLRVTWVGEAAAAARLYAIYLSAAP